MIADAAQAIDNPPATEVPGRRYKIAMFSYALPRTGVKRGGIEQVAHDLANALADRGHAVTVFTYDPRPSTARYETGPLPLRSFVESLVGRRLTMGYLGNVIAVGTRYRSFDVILAHGDSLLLPFVGKPVVRVMHGSAFEEARSATSLGRSVLQMGVYLQELVTARCQKGTVAVSENARRFNPFVRRVVPNGIDLTRFRPDPSRRSRQPSILCVGALTGRKRGSWLIDRFIRDIRPAVPDAALHMVMTPGTAVDGVTYHAGVTTDQLIAMYQQAWVYVSPSTYEGFGLPYVEAMACGTPVVATPNPGSREVLLDGQYGKLAPDDALAEEVCQLLGDPDERARMACQGIARASAFDIARSAEQYEAVIDELVEQHA